MVLCDLAMQLFGQPIKGTIDRGSRNETTGDTRCLSSLPLTEKALHRDSTYHQPSSVGLLLLRDLSLHSACISGQGGCKGGGGLACLGIELVEGSAD